MKCITGNWIIKAVEKAKIEIPRAGSRKIVTE